MENKPRFIVIVGIGETSATIEKIKGILGDSYEGAGIKVVECEDPTVHNLIIDEEIIDYVASKPKIGVVDGPLSDKGSMTLLKESYTMKNLHKSVVNYEIEPPRGRKKSWENPNRFHN